MNQKSEIYQFMQQNPGMRKKDIRAYFKEKFDQPLTRSTLQRISTDASLAINNPHHHNKKRKFDPRVKLQNISYP